MDSYRNEMQNTNLSTCLKAHYRVADLTNSIHIYLVFLSRLQLYYFSHELINKNNQSF